MIVTRWLVASVVALSAAVSSGASGSLAMATHGMTSRARPPVWRVLIGAGAGRHLFHPAGLAIDQRGTGLQKWMYLVDTGNDRVVKFGTGGNYLGAWGSPGIGAGQFLKPGGIAVGPQGDVYVADTGNNRIQVFGAQGRFLAQWGTKGAGPGQFDTPTSVAVGGSGNVFVTDRVNQRIEKFSPTGRLLAVWPVTILSGSDSPVGFGPAGPFALTVDPRGYSYVAVDTGRCSGGHCVMDYIVLETLSPSGTLTRSIVGGNPYGPFLQRGLRQGPWWQISALTVDRRGHLFIAEWSPHDRATVAELSSTATQAGGWQLPKPSGERAWVPQGIAIDPAGTVYVADTLSNRVLKLDF